MLVNEFLILYNTLKEEIDENRIFHDSFHTLAYGVDASFYRLIPKLVIKAKDEKEISFILKHAYYLKISVTFRAAGTSLSGQAITDSVLILAGSEWKNYEVLEEGKKIRLQPGLTGGKVNNILSKFKRQIGPDPASINSAMMGGIVANNASGMCCGTTDNSFHAVDGMRIVFYDGTILDTGNSESRQYFKEIHPEIVEAITTLAHSVKSNTPLVARIQNKFRIKNTTGYSLNAFTNYSNPFDIIEHLMVGSEGTLGFISEITFKTIEDLPYKACAMILFPGIEEACEAVIKLKLTHVSTAELIDRSGLDSVADEQGLPEWMEHLGSSSTALLVETHAKEKHLLKEQIIQIKEAISDIAVEFPVEFTDNPDEYAQFWKIRKGLLPQIGAKRKAGSTVIIEDIAVPVFNLSVATADLKSLIKKYGYQEAVIYGHALEGNLHFVFTQDFSMQEEIDRYEKFMHEIAILVVTKYGGSLKAEHGTGRNMAPYVKFEWGETAYLVMKNVKQIFDPYNILNPGVIINSYEKVHLKNLKPLLPAHKKIDKCIECGFCEQNCVSAGLTLSPRQRIVTFREIKRLITTGEEPHLAASLLNQFKYSGEGTCATDGLCAISCPVKIDTGSLIKELRFENHTRLQNKIAMWIANHMVFVTAIARKSLSFVDVFHSVLGTALMKRISGGMRKLLGNKVPGWTPAMPGGSKRIKQGLVSGINIGKVVYFPSCINRSMGKSQDYSNEEVQLTDKVRQLIGKAGLEIIYPKDMSKLCCGMAFSSKGYKEAGLKKSRELEIALWEASDEGKYPVLCDMSPCLFTMKENMDSKMKLYEPVEFILKYLMPNLEIEPIDEVITVFPVCSVKKMGLDGELIRLARMCATHVIVPETNCCGFAGDKGFLFPELNKHGLKDLKLQIPGNVKNGYSTSRTCEIGLTEHSNISFKSIIYLVDKVSKPKQYL